MKDEILSWHDLFHINPKQNTKLLKFQDDKSSPK